MIQRQAVIDDVIRSHAKGKISKRSNSVVTVIGKEILTAETLTSLKSSCLYEEPTDCVPQWQPLVILWCLRCRYKIADLQKRM